VADRGVAIEQGSGPLVAPLPHSATEYQRRLDGTRALMAERGLDAFISFTPENLYYLTGHNSPGYYFYQACVVTGGHQPVNVLPHNEATNTLGRSWSRLVVGYAHRDDPIDLTLRLLSELGVADQTIGMEGESWFITPLRYLQLQQGIERAGGRMVPVARLVEELRAVKSSEEIAHIRAAARAVEPAMRAAIGASHEGANENQVAAAAVAELILQGSEYAGLPPFITSGPRTRLVHSTWEGRRYEQGDVLVYELPGVIHRYCAPLMRCGTVGPPNDELRRRHELVGEALENVIAAIQPGRTLEEVHRANVATFERHGYRHLLVGLRTAYSVGINYPPDWGEGHILSIWEGDRRPLRPGMTFHLVPGFFDPERYLVVISETVLVTESGCEVLTNFPREPFVV
jgi:Xaa-Pro dipeptidase